MADGNVAELAELLKKAKKDKLDHKKPLQKGQIVNKSGEIITTSENR